MIGLLRFGIGDYEDLLKGRFTTIWMWWSVGRENVNKDRKNGNKDRRRKG